MLQILDSGHRHRSIFSYGSSKKEMASGVGSLDEICQFLGVLKRGGDWVMHPSAESIMALEYHSWIKV